MRSNYSNNKLNHSSEFDTSRKEKLNFSQDGVQVASIETSMETKQIKGRRMGTLAVHGGIPYSLITETESGKKVPMLETPVSEMLKRINNINFVSKIQHFILNFTDAFLVLTLNKDTSLSNLFSEYFEIGDTVSRKAISEMKKANFIRKHSNKIWTFNPYAVFRTTLSVYKLYELQAHWELSNEVKTSWAVIDEKTVWEASEASLNRAVNIVKDKLNDINIKEEELNNLKVNQELVIKTLSAFWRYVKEDSDKETLTDYIKSEKGIRHLRNWWLSENTLSINPFYCETSIKIEFKYQRRNEYRKLFLQMIKEIKNKG